MVTKADFKSLQNLLGGYFYQYWGDDYEWDDRLPNCKDVLHFYKRVNPSSTVYQTIQEIHKFISLELSEIEIANFFEEMGVGYYPPGEGKTYQQWLQEILFILEGEQDQQSFLQQKEYSVWTGWEQYAD
jgi:CdiI immunity protein